MFKRPLVVITLAYISLLLVLKPIIDRPGSFDRALDGQKVSLTGQVVSEITFYDQSLGFEVKALEGLKGRIRVYAPRSDCGYGDRVKIEGRLQIKSSPRNPGLFYSERIALRSMAPVKIISRGQGNWLVRLALQLKKRFLSVIKAVIPPPYDSLLASIILGEAAGDLPEELKEDFKKTGTIHLLVVSGMNLAILIGVISSLFKALKLPKTPALILATLVNILYALIAGGGASIVRAALMAELAVIAKTLDRSYDFPTAASLAALILLILDPANLFDIGFQLSFAATFSVIWMVPILEEKLKAIFPSEALSYSFLRSMLAVSLAPVLATLPIVWFNFSQISLVAPLANVVIITWADLFLILGFAGIGLGALFLPLAQLLAFILIPLLVLLQSLVSFFAGLPGSCIYFPSPSFPLIIGYYMVMLYLFMNKLKLQITKKKLIFALAFIFCLFVWNGAVVSDPASVGNPPLADDRSLRVTILDVGQGDSILVESPSGKKLLIDGGEAVKKQDMGKKVILPYLHRRGINYLDAVVLTHAHSDHLGGLISILKEIKVSQVMDPGLPQTSKQYYYFLSLIDKKKIKYQTARAGQVIDLGAGVQGQILAPEEPFIEASELNNNSMVMRLVYGKIAILLMGDAEKEAEERLWAQPAVLSAQIVKIGHHGSRTGSSEKFLQAVNPQVAVISVGAGNKFRHPHKSTLERLEEMGIKVYRTDQNGAIVINTDGRSYSIQAGLASPLTTP